MIFCRREPQDHRDSAVLSNRLTTLPRVSTHTVSGYRGTCPVGFNRRMTDSPRKPLAGEQKLLTRYLYAITVATIGWLSFAVSSTFLPASGEPASYDQTPLAVLVVFMLAVMGSVEASTTVRRARGERIMTGDGAGSSPRAARLRRLFLAVGVICLLAALIVVVLRWTLLSGVPSIIRALYIGFMVAGAILLASARGLNRGWIVSPLSDLDELTRKQEETLSDTIKRQREEIRQNQDALRESNGAVTSIYAALRSAERRQERRLSPNVIWALVGFGLGIVGNWIAQPLFELLIRPLDR